MPNNIPHPDLEDQKAEGNEGRPSDYAEKLTLGQRFRRTLRGDNNAGRFAGIILDVGESFLPNYVSRARNLFQSKQKDRPMLSRILSIKNFINMKDEDGNFDPQELLASVLQIVIAGAIVWGASALGIWSELSEFLAGE